MSAFDVILAFELVLVLVLDVVVDTLDRLESSAERQQRFVADASHELRSPLTGMRSHLEVDLQHPEEADWRASH